MIDIETTLLPQKADTSARLYPDLDEDSPPLFTSQTALIPLPFQLQFLKNYKNVC